MENQDFYIHQIFENFTKAEVLSYSINPEVYELISKQEFKQFCVSNHGQSIYINTIENGEFSLIYHGTDDGLFYLLHKVYYDNKNQDTITKDSILITVLTPNEILEECGKLEAWVPLFDTYPKTERFLLVSHIQGGPSDFFIYIHPLASPISNIRDKPLLFYMDREIEPDHKPSISKY